MSTEIDYDALEARLTDPDYPVRSAGQVKTGDAAAADGHAFLLREYGSDEAIAAAMSVPRGRPRVGSPKAGPSPTVRARISDADYAAFKKLEAATGRRQSDLVREAVHRLLVDHKLVS
ncbi:hypothetical protein [Flexivirga caeni]|uniref:Ribbon-helix-helix protein, CopG family n=1 Tax=Flexivirga caeni TaxID=2294115 RepID=A0A3M9MDL7_9MICO|nr:hypothetical protein [Flexivirga caeni]RNI23295.1 hypothetical protein EFY87_07695 [Flexivirga caeni]